MQNSLVKAVILKNCELDLSFVPPKPAVFPSDKISGGVLLFLRCFGDSFLKFNLSWITCDRINIMLFHTWSLIYSSSEHVVSQQREAALPKFSNVYCLK